MPTSRAGRSPRRRSLGVAGGLTGLALALASLVTVQTSTSAADCMVAAGGDVAGSDDFQTGAAASAQIIKAAAPTALLALGDLAYDNGTTTEFSSYYAPTWGQFKSLTKPVPGNHEYNSGGGGYYSYFGVSPYYSYDVCGWRAVALNAEIGHSAQIQYLKDQRAAHPDQPFLVYWHEPRWSSGSEHGDDPSYQDLWQAAVDVHAELVLNGHDHDYERFARMNGAGAPDAQGTREFVAGTGGHHPRGFGTIRPQSQMRVSGRPGVLLLTLAATSYSWEYRDTAGTQDKGTEAVAGGLAAGATSTTAASATSSSSPAAAPAGASYTFSDDFDGPAGTAPDPGKWKHAVGGTGWGNDELEYYTDSTQNAALDGQGHLVVTARREQAPGSSCWYGACRYSSARLTTKGTFSQAYGHVEARIKLPQGQGLWPAFWMLGDNIDTVGWPQSGEIDVMEANGNDVTTNESSIHGPGYTSGYYGATVSLPTGQSFAADFHTFAMNWAPGTVTFSLDGKAFKTFTPSDIAGNEWVFDHPFYLLVNLAVGGGSLGSPDATPFPQTLVVDYVHVSASGSSGGSTTSTTSSPVDSSSAGSPTTAPSSSTSSWTSSSTPSTPPSSSTAPATSPPPSGLTPGGPRLIKSSSGRCVTSASKPATSGTTAWLARCTGSRAQRWTVATDGSLRTQGGCLGADASHGVEDAPVGLYTCDGSSAQHWSTGDGRSLQALGACLQVRTTSGDRRYVLELDGCDGGADQQWSVTSG
jgi:beta-glucanase (GH16 family)